jgi:hypothetical protein
MHATTLSVVARLTIKPKPDQTKPAKGSIQAPANEPTSRSEQTIFSALDRR